MENKQSKSLYERIYAELEKADTSGIDSNGESYDFFDKTSAAKAIEQLVLQTQIDLLNQLWQRHMTNNKLLGENFSTCINDLQKQLNELK